MINRSASDDTVEGSVDDRAARLTSMIDAWQNLIFTICYRRTGDYFAAQDLTQETFLSAYRHMESFDGANGKAWLCRIAVNKCLDYLKSAERRTEPAEDMVLDRNASGTGVGSPGEALSGGNPEAAVLERDLREELIRNCRRLSPPYDEAAWQYFVEERTPAEIAERLGLKLKTAQTRISRAREKLKEIYGKTAEGGRSR